MKHFVKITALLLVLTLLAGVLPTTGISAYAKGRLPGDVDGSGALEASDARLALRKAVGLEDFMPGSEEYIAADADKNGLVEAADARLILRASVGLETLPGSGEPGGKEIAVGRLFADEREFACGDRASVTFTVEAKTDLPVYLCEENGSTLSEMKDDGVLPDETANDGVYTTVYSTTVTVSKTEQTDYYARSGSVNGEAETLIFYALPTEEETEQDRIESLEIREMIVSAESKYALPDESVPDGQADDVIEEITAALERESAEGSIAYYEADGDTVFIKMNTGLSFFYTVPTSSSLLTDANGGDTELRIMTMQPVLKDMMEESVKGLAPEDLPELQKFYGILDDAAETVADKLDNCTFSFRDDYDNEEISLQLLKSLPKNSVILIHTHGYYRDSTGPCLLTGEAFDWDRYFWDVAYFNDCVHNRIINGIAPDVQCDRVIITPKFVKHYCKDLSGSFIYLGACSSGKTSELADAFLAKGAQAVVANSETIMRSYNLRMMAATLLYMAETDPADGKYYTLSEALNNAKAVIGSDDSGQYHGSGAHPDIFGGTAAQNFRLSQKTNEVPDDPDDPDDPVNPDDPGLTGDEECTGEIAPQSSVSYTVPAAVLEKKSGRITEGTTYAEYGVTAPRNGFYRFELADVPENVRFRMYLYNSYGEQIGYDYSLSNGGGLTKELKAGASYKVRVEQYSGTGSFTLLIGSQKSTVTVGQTDVFSDSLQFTDQHNYYAFTPARDGRYRFELSNVPENVRFRMFLYNEYGEQLKYDYSLANGGGLTADLTGGKNYTVCVSTYSGKGSYKLNFGKQKARTELRTVSSVKDSIQFTDQRNDYSFVPPRDGTYRFEFANVPENVRLRLTLYNGRGEQLASDYSLSNGGGLTVSLLAGKIYTVSVSYYSSKGSYTLTVGRQTAPSVLTAGTVNGAITFTDQRNNYSFTPAESAEYSIGFGMLAENFRLRLAVSDNDGNTLFSDYSLGSNFTRKMSLEAGRTYTVTVGAYRGTGQYTLTAAKSGDYQPPYKDYSSFSRASVADIPLKTAAVRQPQTAFLTAEPAQISVRSGRLTDQTESVDYSYTAPINGTYRFELSEVADGIRFRMYLFNAAGEKLKDDYSLSNGGGLTYDLEAGKSYTVRVQKYSGAGSFTLTVFRPRAAMTVGADSAVSDRIIFRDQCNDYRFTPTVSGIHRFELSNVPNNVSFRMFLFNEYGEQLKNDYSLSNGEGLTHELEAGKTYTVRVTTYSGTGSYTLCVGGQNPSFALSDFTSVQDVIRFTDQQNDYTFVPQRGGIYRFEFGGVPNGISFRMYLFNAYGEQLKYDYSLGNGAGLTCTLEAGQTYTVRVKQYSSKGSYTLTVGRQKAEGTLRTNTAVTDSTQFTSQRNLYRFTPSVSGRQRIEFSSVPGGVKLRMYIFNEAMEQLKYDYSLANGSGLEYDFIAGNTYYIAVDQYSGFGDYTVRAFVK